MDIKNQPKTAKKFECDFCHYKCSKASNWSEHLSTRKHNLLSKGYIKDKKGYINPAGENENSIFLFQNFFGQLFFGHLFLSIFRSAKKVLKMAFFVHFVWFKLFWGIYYISLKTA